MKITAWIHEHPTETILGVAALIGAFFLLTRSGSGSGTAASYYGAQASIANQQANYAAIQAQEQSQTEQAQIAADATNYQTLASLAAVKTQYDAAVQAATIQAGVANNQIAAQESVINTQTNAAENVQNNVTSAQQALGESYINAETEQLNSELTASEVMQKQQYDFQNSFAKNVTTFNGSQNRLAFLQSLLFQPGAASSTEMAYAGVNNPQYGYGTQVGNILTGIGNVLKGWFS